MSIRYVNHTGLHDCRLTLVNKPVTAHQLETATATVLMISGMGCPTCAMRVRNGLLSLVGVLAVEIAVEQGLAFVCYDAAQVLPEALPDAVAAAGDVRHCYTARVLDRL